MNSLVIGVGNRLRGDDGIGLAVAETLRMTLADDTHVLALEHVGPNLFERWADAHTVLLVDASCSGAAPGTVQRLDARNDPLPAETFRLSTHGFGLPEAIELARVLDRLPERLVVFAVEGAEFEHGADLSPRLLAARDELVDRIREELAHA